MFGFGQKRSRVAKAAAFRPRRTTIARAWDALQDRDILLRLGMCLVAVLLLLVVLQGWRAPFTYRIGHYSQNGISARTDFQELNSTETNRKREDAERRVPLVFKHDPQSLSQLPDRLRADLGKITQATSVDRVEESTQLAFGLLILSERKLTPSQREASAKYGVKTGAESQERFQAIRTELISAGMESSEQRIDDIVDDFSRFISPLSRNGIVDLEEVRNERITDDRMVRVESVAGGTPPVEKLLTQVRLPDQLNNAGELGKTWLSFPSLRPSLQDALCHWLMATASPTLRFDQVATKAEQRKARESELDVMTQYIAGDPIVRPGEMVTAEMLRHLEVEYRTIEGRLDWVARATRLAVLFSLVIVLSILTGYYAVHNEPRLVRNPGRLAVYLTALVLTAGLARLLSFDPLRAEIVPLLVTTMILAIAYNQELALLTGFALSLLITLGTTAELGHFVELVGTAAAAVIPLNRVRSRSTLIKVGFTAAFVNFLVVGGVGVVQSQSVEMLQETHLLTYGLKSAAWSLAAGYFVAGSLPFVEQVFDVVTDIKLLEMSDPSHPLLQELVRRAPGTYNHSIAVASLAEAAAESIGANGLLVRVGAYFHDIGKMLKPHYFIENVQSGSESKHEHLAPAMSTLIIIGHVKDGVDMARQHHLPKQLIDFIEQHHGTTLVEYFYREATRQAEQQPDQAETEESSFRYPGPKPQTREAGVLMIADAVESASRTLTDPTPKRLETLVHSITMKKLLDRQFDECSLRLSEIRSIEQSLVKSLIGVYHGRIRYPEAKRA
ncbi:MAG: HDIG domain-containing protein [Planctomycetota bacterium]|nr:MAG: HDIG domain-containing protein [Planctomycetota bacterium]